MTWYTNNNSGQPLSPAQYDREILMLCDPSGSKVLVQDVTSVEAPLGTAPTLLAWNLNGTPYAGAISDLKNCNTDTIEIEKEYFCVDGKNNTKLIGVEKNSGTILWTLWLDEFGNVIQSPFLPIHSTVGGWTGGVGQPLTTGISAVITQGVCKIELNKNKFIFLDENTGVLTLGDIITTLPSNSIVQSITVTQEEGIGKIAGDSGGGVLIETFRVYSFSTEELSSFNQSLLTINAGVGGRQRISIIYSI